MIESKRDRSNGASTFNLVTEPWVRVRLMTGELAELSLREVFAGLGEVRSLAGEVSVQDAAVLRLLLAIAHRALGPSGEEQEYASPIEEWKALHDSPGELGAEVVAYLDDYLHRFDLFDAERPFYQVAGLTTGKDELGPLVRFVVDVPNDEDKQYFTTRGGREIESLSFSEAARWLVTTQAFDPSGIKSGVLDDPRTKGGKGYPIGAAWAAQLEFVALVGENLEKTLLLNLVRGNPATGMWLVDEEAEDQDIPPWEREGDAVIRAGVRPGTLGEPGAANELAPVQGVVDALTWQSRRILLQHDGERVVGVLIANGDRADLTNRMDVEFMTPWRQSASDAKAKTTSVPTLRPRFRQPERALWRGLAGILPVEHIAGQPLASVPGIVEWNARLQLAGAVPADRHVLLRATWLKLDSNNAIVQDVIDDSVDLAVVLFDGASARSRALIRSIERSVIATDEAIRALGRLASSLARAAGNSDSDVYSRAVERGYFAVDAAFRAWLRDIEPGVSPDAAEARWHERAYGLVRTLGDDLAVDPALASERASLRDLGAAEEWFRANLANALPSSEAGRRAAEARDRARQEAEKQRASRTHRSSSGSAASEKGITT